MAIGALLEYFDWCTMELLYKDGNKEKGGTMALSKSTRYAPLLMAKTYKLFGIR